MATKKKRTTRTHQKGRRTDVWLMDPEDLIIIGLDTTDGPEHPLWDERIDLPIDDSMVRNIQKYGVLEAITARRGKDGAFEVVDGRRRVRHARVANERIKEAGDDAGGAAQVVVPVLPSRGTEEVLGELSVALNEIRADDPTLVKAAKCGRMLLRNRGNYAACAVAFGVEENTIRNWEVIDSLSQPVKDAISAGQIAATSAMPLAKLDAKKQEKELKKLIKEAGGKRPTRKDAEGAANGSSPRKRAAGGKPTKAVIEYVLQNGDISVEVKDTLMWVLGDEESAQDVPGLTDALIQMHKEQG